jgi:putative ABC transport system permease protein
MVELNRTLDYFLSDLNITLDRMTRTSRIYPLVKSLPEVRFVEGWSSNIGQLLSPDKLSSMQVGLYSLPPETDLIHPTISSGRWLQVSDENAVVIGSQLSFQRPDIHVGSDINIEFDGKAYPFRVVGVYQFAGNVIPPILYANQHYVSRLFNQVDLATEYRVLLKNSDFAAQDRNAEALREVFTRAGFNNFTITTGYVIKSQQANLINVLIVILIALSLLIALVGGLGLAGTMSMNVLERTREIGVMRAIGARNHDISQMVVVEGMLIGLLSWVLAGLTSVPITLFLNNILGVALLNVPMETRYSPTGFIIWLGLVVAISAVASMLPARNATRLTVREVLAYE